MSKVRDQYEAYPYPERDPKDEAKRLILGSPSHPLEIDHFIFGGQRDWSRPLRVLVAGGGTGDALIQLAQMMAQVKKPYEITYVDLSTGSRKVAEARAKARGLGGIKFVTGSLLDAPELGQFDYIDCCGVLHHLPEPEAGFAALRAALAPGGGLGFMVYAPYGRSGVYPLQEAFGSLYQGLDPKDRLKAARKVVEALPDEHPFKVNKNVVDHHNGDAGFYDLLLHSQDRSFDVTQLVETMAATGWALSGFTTPILYDLSRITEVPEHMGAVEAMAVAEKLQGLIKTHVGYAVADDDVRSPASGKNRALIPHLKGVQPRAVAQTFAKGKSPILNLGKFTARLSLPKAAAPLLAAIDGRKTVDEIAAVTKTDPIAMGALWGRIDREMTGWGMLLYSSILK